MNRFIKLAILLLFSILFLPYAAAREKAVSMPEPAFQTTLNLSFDEAIRREVEKRLGVKYRRGGSSEKGVDCSGFIRLIYRNVFGIDLPYTAFNQYLMPIFKTVSLTELRTGDLIFFSPTAKKKKINHVGIYLSNGDFAHAIQRRGVIVSSFENRYWKSRIISTKRIVKGKIKNENDSQNLCQPSIEDLGCFFFPFDG